MRDQPAGRGEVGPGAWRGGLLVLDAAGPVVGQEVGQVDQRRRRSPAPVLLQGVPAGEDQGVELPERRGRSRRSTARPAAAACRRGSSGCSRASQRLAVVLPEQVHRADQPVLVRGHDPDGMARPGPARRARRRARCCGSGRRRSSGVEHSPQGLGLEERPAGGLGGHRREDAEAALQRVEVHARRRLVRAQRVPAADGVEGVDAVGDVDLMPPPARAPARRSTYAASPPKLWAPKNVVTMQIRIGALPGRRSRSLARPIGPSRPGSNRLSTTDRGKVEGSWPSRPSAEGSGPAPASALRRPTPCSQVEAAWGLGGGVRARSA